MPPSLPERNIAILAADGFDEHQMTEIQRALVKARARLQIIAPESGVVNGWQGEGWGHHFHVDAPIFEAMGSDFDMLILPGGTRSADKLAQNPHTKRIINHFLDARKPISAISAGVGLLALGTKIAGRVVAAAVDQHAALLAKEAQIGADDIEEDGNLLTAAGADITAWVEASIAFFSEADSFKRAA